MVAVAAIFIHYQLTPTRRSRGQVMLLTSREPLRIRNRTPAVSTLLIRFAWAKTTYTNTYTYTFNLYAPVTVPLQFFRCDSPLRPLPPLLLPPIAQLLSKLTEPYILIRSPLERRSYVASYINHFYICIYILIRIYILIVYDLRRLDGVTLFR